MGQKLKTTFIKLKREINETDKNVLQRSSRFST